MARGEDFQKATQRLANNVGNGELVGEVVVDQPYAQYQHETMDLKHPRGGGPKYLERPFQEKYRQYLQNVADDILDGGGAEAMVQNMEGLSKSIAETAPVDELPNPIKLRYSGSPSVYSNGHQVYHRPPRDAREKG